LRRDVPSFGPAVGEPVAGPHVAHTWPLGWTVSSIAGHALSGWGAGETGVGGSLEADGAVPTAPPAQVANRLAGFWHLDTGGPRARAVAFRRRAFFLFFRVSNIQDILLSRQKCSRQRVWMSSTVRGMVEKCGGARSVVVEWNLDGRGE